MTTRATTWAAQIAVVLALLLTSTASASSGFLTGNSCRGENSLEDGLHRGQASANAGTHRVCDEFCLTSAADSVVAPIKTGPIKANEATTYQDFVNRSVVGDKLEGHELWQHANLKSNGLATERLSTAASQNNPVIALDRATHVKVNAAQRALDAANMTPLENIRANAKILRDLKAAPESVINEAEQAAIQHAKSLGYTK